MSDINADPRWIVELTKAQILAGGIKAGMDAQASDTGERIQRSVDGLTYRYDKSLTSNTTNDSSVTGTTAKDALETLDTKIDDSLASKRDIIHSFVDPYNMAFFFDNALRTMTYTHPSGFVEFWAGKTYYKIANGDSRLTVTVPSATQPAWSYFDIDGQLKYKTTLDWVDVDTVCLGHLAKYSTTHVNPDTSVGAFILSIARWEDCQANHVENKASYLSKGIQVVRGQSIDFTAAIGDTITGYTSASYLSARDFQFWISSTNADAINWLRYHYDGEDAAGQYNAILSVSLAPTGTPIIVAEDVGLVGTNAIYNNLNGGTGEFEVLICPANDFVIGQIGVADGGSQKVIALAPQGKYATENEARLAIEAQEKQLTNNDNIFRDIAVVASFIVKGNLAGGFLDATGDGHAFYLHDIAGQGGGGGGANNQGLEDVIAIDPIALSVPNFSGGANFDGGGVEQIINNERIRISNGTISKLPEIGGGDPVNPFTISNDNSIFPNVELTSIFGNVVINSPTTTQTAQENAEAGDKGLMSVEGAGYLQTFTPTLTNGWVLVGGTSAHIEKDATNLVTIAMSLDGSASTGTRLTGLPAEFRPKVPIRASIEDSVGSSVVVVLTDGEVYSTSMDTEVSLAINYRA